jgi:hypothetical protein
LMEPSSAEKRWFALQACRPCPNEANGTWTGQEEGHDPPKVTKEDCAKVLGVSQATISRWVREPLRKP